MSLSSKSSSQDNNASPNTRTPSGDLHESEDWNVPREHTSASGDDSLVEHVLDFLEKYPIYFASQTPSMGIRSGLLRAF
jgi:hypothetical protein